VGALSAGDSVEAEAHGMRRRGGSWSCTAFDWHVGRLLTPLPDPLSEQPVAPVGGGDDGEDSSVLGLMYDMGDMDALDPVLYAEVSS
jgi:hypothetical protein